jgi:hypothetical protein
VLNVCAYVFMWCGARMCEVSTIMQIFSKLMTMTMTMMVLHIYHLTKKCRLATNYISLKINVYAQCMSKLLVNAVNMARHGFE